MRFAKEAINSLARRAGYTINRLPRTEARVPIGAEERLRPDHPELQRLRSRYAELDPSVTQGFQWTSRTISSRDLLQFRGDNAFVWQREPDASYVLSARYAKSIDTHGLLDRLDEDGLFGARSVEVDGKAMSRDLIDSVLEMRFLQRQGIHPATVLDIGAGYGRLAHRMTTAYPGITYTCVDAIAVSTYLSRFYLKFRISPAHVIELSEFKEMTVDLTVNIHSFTECTIDAVNWWLSRVRTKHLMIVPNAMDHGGEMITNSRHENLLPVIRDHGFHLVAKEPKYTDRAVQTYGVQPTWYYLFASQSV